MTQPAEREFQAGDFVEFCGLQPWGVYVVLGFKSWKTLWVRDRHHPQSKRLAARRRRLRLVAPVEQIVAEVLMETEA